MLSPRYFMKHDENTEKFASVPIYFDQDCRFSGASSFKDLYTILQVSRLISFSIDGQRSSSVSSKFRLIGRASMQK